MRKNKIITFIIMALIILSLILGYNLYDKSRAYKVSTENNYNMAFYELVDYMQNVKTYLAKSLITSDDKHGAETLTHIWREANLAQTYLSMLPMESQELENTEKFLNQVSEYSYALSRKNINNEDLSEDDFENLKNLYSYSVDLSNVLNQLSADIESGRVTWKDLKHDGNTLFAQQVSNVSQDSFGALEENFHEYAGLIYDGAFSEHMTSTEKKGLTGEKVSEEKWIIDGTYRSTLDERLKRSDLIIYLDYSTLSAVKGAVGRYIKNHGKEKPDIPGCNERMSFDFLMWVFNWRKNKRKEVIEKIEKVDENKLLIFKNRRKLNKWFKNHFNTKIKV